MLLPVLGQPLRYRTIRAEPRVVFFGLVTGEPGHSHDNLDSCGCRRVAAGEVVFRERSHHLRSPKRERDRINYRAFSTAVWTDQNGLFRQPNIRIQNAPKFRDTKARDVHGNSGRLAV